MKTKTRKVTIVLMLIFSAVFLSCCAINSFATTIYIPTYGPPDFGLPEEYERSSGNLYNTISLPLAPVQQVSIETYLHKDAETWGKIEPVRDSFSEEEKRIDLLMRESPIVLILKPETADWDYRYLPSEQYTRPVVGEAKPDDGMTLTKCTVTKVLRNQTAASVEEGKTVWIKEDYFTYKDENGTTLLYSPAGSDLNPLEYESLVFCDIYTQATKTEVLAIDPIHFTVNGPIGKHTADAPHRALSNVYASEERLWENYGKKVCKFFGIQTNPYYHEQVSSFQTSFFSSLIGFGVGALAVAVPMVVVWALRRRRSKKTK